MEESVDAYVRSLAHSLVQAAVLCQDFTVVLRVDYGEAVTVRIGVVAGVEAGKRTRGRKRKEKAKRYRKLLRSKEEEIERLKEEIRNMQKGQVETLTPDTPLSSSTEKTYKINFSRSQSPVSECPKPQTVFSRKSSWERTTQTENQTSLAKMIS